MSRPARCSPRATSPSRITRPRWPDSSRARALVPEQFRTDPEAQQRALSLATEIFRAAGTLATGGTPADSGRIAALVRVSGGTLPSPLAASLLALSRSGLDATRTLVVQALGAARHQNIYTSQVPFLQGVPPFPATLPSGTIRTLAGQLYGTYLRANHVPDDALTGRARDAAAARVEAVRVSYRRGQAIVRGGRCGGRDTALAALRAAGLTGSNGSWQLLFADLMICLVVAGLLHGYLISIRSPILIRPPAVAPARCAVPRHPAGRGLRAAEPRAATVHLPRRHPEHARSPCCSTGS